MCCAGSILVHKRMSPPPPSLPPPPTPTPLPPLYYQLLNLFPQLCQLFTASERIHRIIFSQVSLALLLLFNLSNEITCNNLSNKQSACVVTSLAMVASNSFFVAMIEFNFSRKLLSLFTSNSPPSVCCSLATSRSISSLSLCTYIEIDKK